MSEITEPVNQIHRVETEAKNGQSKCPKCGASDISPLAEGEYLRCNYCRHVFTCKLFSSQTEISQLTGEHIARRAADIIPDASEILTLKCESCGAEVVIDTASALQARCHWCRNTLSLNSQVPNGAVPDALLPFKITKEEARQEIKKFVSLRKFFANRRFKKEFNVDNIYGVYLPYMMIDVNAHLSFAGTGEKLVRSYSVRCDEDSDKTITLHDADAFQVSRDFDLSVKNLTVESSKDKLDTRSKTKTNYVINAIMPFDTENCVRFDANYLRGYTSEKRDTNVANLKPIVHTQVTDIARYEANKTIAEYDRGVAWEEENLTVKGDSWTTAYLPVWIYSYMQVKRKRKILHYVAVNARTKETMGSVPLNYRRLIFFTFWLWLSGLGFVPFLHEEYRMLSFVPCIAFFIFMFRKYRNLGARHEYEKETYREVRNIVPIDRFLEHRTELSETRIEGANNHAMKGFTERFTISDTLEEMVKMGEKYNGIQEKLYTRKEEWLSKRKRN